MGRGDPCSLLWENLALVDCLLLLLHPASELSHKNYVTEAGENGGIIKQRYLEKRILQNSA